MPLSPAESRLMEGSCRAAGVPWTDEQARQLGIYKDEILDWSKRVNLVSSRDIGRLVKAHFVDCVRPLPYLPGGGSLRLLDLGSGAGLPGLVLKVLRPELDVLLVESNRKKCLFLMHVIRELALSLTRVLAVRSEEIETDSSYAGKFGAVVVRAVGRLSKIIPQAAPFVGRGGIIITYKPSPAGKEVEEAREVAARYQLNGPEVAPEGGPARRGSLVLIRRS